MRRPRRIAPLASRFAPIVISMLIGSLAHGQAQQRALFVCNDGDLEGSLTSFTFGADGVLTLADRVVTGARATLGDPCPGPPLLPPGLYGPVIVVRHLAFLLRRAATSSGPGTGAA